jgi:hypothetical protein
MRYRKAPILAGVACATLALVWLGSETRSESGPPFYLGGIQVNETDHVRWVETLSEIGMNTVSVTVYARQGDWDGDDLRFNVAEPAVVDEIRSAKSAGLHVVLILRVALDHAFPRNEFIWHGMIMPRTDALIDSWFSKYERFVTMWAEIAEREGVEVLGIGSEMNALTATLPIGGIGNLRNYYVYAWYQRLQHRRALRFADELEHKSFWLPWREDHPSFEAYLDARLEKKLAWARQAYLRAEDNVLRKINARRRRVNDHWVRLIERTRTVFDGTLTYAANFDAYQNVGFWRHLDLIGINSYFPLRDGVDDGSPSARLPAIFRNRWRTILAEIQSFKERQGLPRTPILFTELGLTSRANCTVEPWSHSGFSILPGRGGRKLVIWKEQPVNPDERRMALEALHAVYREDYRGLLRGILYWKLSTIRSHARIEPYVLHIGSGSTDALQDVLVRFTR